MYTYLMYLKNHSSTQNFDGTINKLRCHYIDWSIFCKDEFVNCPEAQPCSSQKKKSQKKYSQLQIMREFPQYYQQLTLQSLSIQVAIKVK